MTGWLLALAILHGADAATTVYGLHHGAQELNPIAGFDVPSVIVSRAAFATVEIAMLHALWPQHPTLAKRLSLIAVSVSAIGVGRNLSVIVRLQ